MHIRLLKDIAIDRVQRTVILLSHDIDLPADVRRYSARFAPSLPNRQELWEIVEGVAGQWAQEHRGKQVKTNQKVLHALIRNLTGLTANEAQRLARNVIYDDGAITPSDLPTVQQAKYRLLHQDGLLSFEYDTAQFADIGGLRRLKDWLEQRQTALHHPEALPGLDPPKGILLLGVRGCGKSLAAKAAASIYGVPLLRLDFGNLCGTHGAQR